MNRYLLSLVVSCVSLTWCYAQPKDPDNLTGNIRDSIKQVIRYKVDPRDKNQQPMKCWIASDQCEPLELPKAGATQNPAKVALKRPIAWLEPFYIAKETERYTLIVRSEDGESIDEYVGWVPSDHVIHKPEAIADPDTKIHFKAMIMNSPSNLTEAAVDEGARGLKHPGPNAVANNTEPLRLFGIYFVYAKTKDYTLLGGREKFNPIELGPNDVQKTIMGWIKNDRLVEWNTREAVQWNYQTTLKDADPRRTKPGKIYRTPDAALADTQANAMLDPKDIIATENIDPATGESVQLRPSDMRYPLLKWKDTDPLKDRPDSEFVDEKHGQLRRVGVIGGFSGNAKFSAGQLKSLQDLFTTLQTQVRETEILFVIDDTESMQDWFKSVADVVRQINESTQGDPNRVVRIALTYYNDNYKTKGNTNAKNKGEAVVPWDGKTWEFRNIKEVGIAIAKELESHAVQDGGDRPEMVYQGIIDSIDRCKFSDNSRKMVIVIGDAGDREANDRELITPNSLIKGYPNAYNINKVIERLSPLKKVPFEFYAFQVNDPVNAEAIAFRKQMLEIRDGLKTRNPASNGGVFKGDEQSELTSMIKKQYTALKREADKAEQAMKEGARGQFKSSLLSPGMEAIIADKLKDLNIPGLDINKLKSLEGFQLFEVGYVWEEQNKTPQISKMLFLDDDAVKNVHDMLTRLESPDRTKRPDIKQLLVELANTTVGEIGGDTSKIDQIILNDVIKKSLGIEFKSSFFKTRIDALDGPGLNSAVRQNEYYELMHKRDRLADLRNNKEFGYEEVTVMTGGTNGQRVKRRNQSSGQDNIRDFPLPGAADSRYFWVDQDQEFP